MEGKGKGRNMERGNYGYIKNHMETYYCRSFLKYLKNLNRVTKYKDRQCPNYTFLNHKIKPPVSGMNYNLLKHCPMEPLYFTAIDKVIDCSQKPDGKALLSKTTLPCHQTQKSSRCLTRSFTPMTSIHGTRRLSVH